MINEKLDLSNKSYDFLLRYLGILKGVEKQLKDKRIKTTGDTEALKKARAMIRKVKRAADKHPDKPIQMKLI